MIAGDYEVGPDEKIIHATSKGEVTVVVWNDPNQVLQMTRFLGTKISHMSELSNPIWIKKRQEPVVSEEQIKFIIQYPGFVLFRLKRTFLSFKVQGWSPRWAILLDGDWRDGTNLLDWEFSSNFGPWYQVSAEGYNKWLMTP